MNSKKLIESAMPVKEISAESVRDKSIRHGHISTLHLWWARRPLPVCRAVVFASLVPDPLDDNCPAAFKEAVELLLGKAANSQDGDPYKPYDDIPWTSVVDPMEDNLRNRLLMFIGKFSPKYLENERRGKKTPPKEQLDTHSLIKWENKNNETILNKARQLIFVAHNAENGDHRSASELLSEFDQLYAAIKKAEKELYQLPDRHLETEQTKQLQDNLNLAIEAFQNKMPIVFDPFAGGGAIPLEAARLGCRSYGNDINPVAHIIQKGSVEFPQKFGKPITYTKKAFIDKYGQEAFDNLDNQYKGFTNGNVTHVNIPNRLAFDVEYFAKKMLNLAEKEIGHLYPTNNKGDKPIAYYWARTAKCANPSCGAEVPLLKQFYLVNTKKNKRIYLQPLIQGNKINFEIKSGQTNQKGWLSKNALICPICKSSTSVKELKEQSKKGLIGLKMLAVIEESNDGKTYRLPTQQEIEKAKINPKLFNPNFIQPVKMQETPDLISGRGWGINNWLDLFTPRQLLAMQTLINALQEIKTQLNPWENDYHKAIVSYISIIISKYSDYNNSFTVWTPGAEQLSHTFSKQALPMVFDFPESNPFKKSGGSPLNMMGWVVKYIESESFSPFSGIFQNSSSGDIRQFPPRSIDSTVTDPPYYNAIAYADISDFFYVWLKRALNDLYPNNFSYPQTPKTEECTALKHHHQNDIEKANSHFESKLLRILKTIEVQTKGIVSIMFAHQSTKAWTTLCNSILGANMNINSSWALDSERSNRALGLKGAVLASSVTVCCKPSNKEPFGEYRIIRRSIEDTIRREVKLLYGLGFRGADLLTACFGQAVKEFGKYETVERADGSKISVEELLKMAREAAFNAIISDIDTDDVTKFYIGWLNLFGFTEAEHDDIRRITQIGLNIDVNQLQSNHILITLGNKQSLATYRQRNELSPKLGEGKDNSTIDLVHKAMALYKGTNRKALLTFIAQHAATPESSFWRVANSLAEILPPETDDHVQVSGLLTNKESLIREAKNIKDQQVSQGSLEM